MSADGNDTLARTAMEELCRTSSYPIFAFALGMGLSPADAEDRVLGLLRTPVEFV